MTSCEIIPMNASKACSGKCKAGNCNSSPRVWVVAACEGMISLFSKNENGNLDDTKFSSNAVFSSLEEFQKTIDKAQTTHSYDQLVIVGSGNDIAWVHASLPPQAMLHIAAEIKYPLVPDWFRQEPPLKQLNNALRGVFQH